MGRADSSRLNVGLVISRYFSVIESHADEDYLEYVILSWSEGSDKLFDKLYIELVGHGVYPMIHEVGGVKFVRVYIPRKRSSPAMLSLALFLVTMVSVLLTGYFVILNYFDSLRSILNISVREYDMMLQVLSFTACIVIPLIAHELGHWYVAKRYHIPASYPFFIPAPFISPLGTFGAIVRMEFFPKNLRDLLVLGVTGPILGFITSYALFIANYILSPRVPRHVIQVALSEGIIQPLGIAPLSAMITFIIDAGQVGSAVILNPAAYASLLIIAIHFLNLLPIGQLDGGHVVRGLTSIGAHTLISYMAALTTFLTSLVILASIRVNIMWVSLFALAALILTGLRPHVGSANMISSYVPMGVKLKILAIYITLLIMTMPVPLTR